MSWYTIGTLSFPASWVSILLAFFLTGLFLSLRKRKDTANWYGNVVFIFILTWKLSVILFQFKMILSNPLAILYFNGGIKGLWIGVAAAILYTYFYVKKNVAKIEEFIQAWLFFIVIYEVASAYLIDVSTMWVVVHLLIGIVVVTFSLLKEKQLTWQLQIMVLYIGILALIYSLQNQLLTLPIAIYVIIAMILSILAKIRRTESD
ncbi:hypothetical protein ACFFF5_15855 [Lederbergia wuyishanensis]|uniref:Signal transduction histidine kinase n=1 Tax=Lederbergia wuyishanensis TaxID=1347903 RepID=A0ABU0D8T4_9BACI|nr:hypothetical protein [Lederbergia wuyishanensis]MCJ8007645.1 hypothetical protein [Lederbergia wuyishanensis]MDQ0344770.1 signal transduction histidine kinase [Lederbergia wuyishanensis]